MPYELRIHCFNEVGTTRHDDRHTAEACLQAFAAGAGLDVHLHPSEYTGVALSSAYRKGGDPLFDAVAIVRRVAS